MSNTADAIREREEAKRPKPEPKPKKEPKKIDAEPVTGL
jgi:hypothetical protein